MPGLSSNFNTNEEITAFLRSRNVQGYHVRNALRGRGSYVYVGGHRFSRNTLRSWQRAGGFESTNTQRQNEWGPRGQRGRGVAGIPLIGGTIHTAGNILEGTLRRTFTTEHGFPVVNMIPGLFESAGGGLQGLGTGVRNRFQTPGTVATGVASGFATGGVVPASQVVGTGFAGFSNAWNRTGTVFGPRNLQSTPRRQMTNDALNTFLFLYQESRMEESEPQNNNNSNPSGPPGGGPGDPGPGTGGEPVTLHEQEQNAIQFVGNTLDPHAPYTMNEEYHGV